MNDAKKIDRPEVLEHLRAIVEEKGPDYRYPDYTCTYKNEDGSPSCIVGHVLDRLGLLSGLDREDVNAGDLNEAGLNFTGDALNVLAVAQETQDDWESGVGLHNTWGLALKVAEQEAA